MFDAHLRRWIDPPLDRIGRAMARSGIGADAVTIAGAGLGLAAALAVAGGLIGAALVLFLAGRVLDGLDGAVSRATRATDRGGYLDIVLDFAVYAALPLGFAVVAPSANALAAATLLAAIVLNGIAFLAFAVMAERRGLETRAQGRKSLYYMAGLAEGVETIAAYSAMLVFPGWFAGIAFAFAGLCLVSAIGRIAMAWQQLSGPKVRGPDGV